MTFSIVLLALLGIFIVLMIFWTGFRNWIAQQLNALWLLLLHYAPAVWAWLRDLFDTILLVLNIYIRILFWTILGALLLTTLALIIKVPWFTGLAFTLSISALLLAWLPAGLVLRLFRVNSAVVPQSLRVAAAWVAFIGFLGIVAPGVMTFTAAMGAALVAFILMGTASKFSLLDKLVVPLVIVMCLVIGWRHFFPEDYRSTVRYVSSWGKRVNTIKDRGSIDNETDAATTYAYLQRDVKVVYSASDETLSDISEIKVSLAKGTLVKIFNHKSEVTIFEGQGFVKIQLAKDNGSFVKGPKYWIEAELVSLVAPRRTIPKEVDSTKLIKTPPVDSAEYLLAGQTYTYDLIPHQTTSWKQIPAHCVYEVTCACSAAAPTFCIYYSDGTVVDFTDGRRKELPAKEEPVIQVASRCDEPMVLTIVVAPRTKV